MDEYKPELENDTLRITVRDRMVKEAILLAGNGTETSRPVRGRPRVVVFDEDPNIKYEPL